MATTTVAPILIQQMNKTFYVGFGALHSIQEAVDAAVASGHPSMVVIPQGYWGTDLISDVVNGTDWIYLTDQRGWNPFYYLWENNQYRGPFINLSGKINEDTLLDLNGNTLTIGGDGSLSVPNLTAANASFDAALVDGSPVRTFENTGDPGTGATYPPAGIAVSTGSGWGASLNPSNSFLPLTGGTLTGTLNFYTSSAPTNQKTNTIFNASDGSFSIAALSDDGTVTNPWIICHKSGDAPTDVSIPATIFCNSTINGAGFTCSGETIQLLRAGVQILSINGGYSGNPSLYMNNVWSDPDEAKFQMSHGNALSFEFLDRNNNASQWLLVARSGNTATGLWFTAPLNAPAKNFVIPHPKDDSKTLHHSCVEGPEHAVFYRGEAETTNGIVEITLPDYFEALTLKDGRTVQVTPLIEEDNASFGACAATRVSDGKFRVCSTTNSQKFYWEVKAVRSDLPPLEAVRPASEGPQARQAASEPAKAAPKKKAGKR